VRRLPLLLLLLLAPSCLAPRAALTTGEIELVAWYIEDVCHGLPRRPGELAAVDASDSLQGIAAWAVGTERDGVSVAHPDRMEARRTRWRLLAAAARDGLLRSSADGLLELLPAAAELKPTERQVRELLAADLARENRARLELDALLLSRAGLRRDSPAGESLLTELRRARSELDQQAGVRAP
jgi:hypothetical protein